MRLAGLGLALVGIAPLRRLPFAVRGFAHLTLVDLHSRPLILGLLRRESTRTLRVVAVINAAARGVEHRVALLPCLAVGRSNFLPSAAVVVVHRSSASKRATCGPHARHLQPSIASWRTRAERAGGRLALRSPAVGRASASGRPRIARPALSSTVPIMRWMARRADIFSASSMASERERDTGFASIARTKRIPILPHAFSRMVRMAIRRLSIRMRIAGAIAI